MIFSPFISLRRLPQLNLSDLEEEEDDDEEMEKKKMEKMGSRKIVGVR